MLQLIDEAEGRGFCLFFFLTLNIFLAHGGFGCLEALFSAQGIQDEALRATLGSRGAKSRRLAVVFFSCSPAALLDFNNPLITSFGGRVACNTQPLATSNGRKDRNKKETSALAMGWYHQCSAFYSCVVLFVLGGFWDEK